MTKKFDAYYYNNNSYEIESTKDIFEEYQADNQGCSSFPEYMECFECNYDDLAEREESLLMLIEDRVKYNIRDSIDEIREYLDELEEVYDHIDEEPLKWEMIEVLE